MLKQNMLKSQQRHFNPQTGYTGNEEENEENCDESIASVKLNQSDLNQLDKYDFNFPEDGDDDEDDNDANDNQNEQNSDDVDPNIIQERTPTNSSVTKEPLTHLISNNNEFKILAKQNDDFVQKFNMLESVQDDHDDLSNESVNILRISDSKLDLEASSVAADQRPFSYASFDRVNDSANQSAVFKVPDQVSLVTETSCDRVNQIVRQSMARTARSLMEKSESLLKNDFMDYSTLSNAECVKKLDTERVQAQRKSEASINTGGSMDEDALEQTPTNLASYANSRVLGSIYYKPWPVADTSSDQASVFRAQNEETLNESQLKLDSSLFVQPNNNNSNINNNHNCVTTNMISDFPFDKPIDDEEYRNNLFAPPAKQAPNGSLLSKRFFFILNFN
jgi:hypothetical protein